MKRLWEDPEIAETFDPARMAKRYGKTEGIALSECIPNI